jgi:hypothetical protein
MMRVIMNMNTKEIPQKFMRPRNYAERVDINWRTCYRYVSEGLFPGYKFQGIVLLDVAECDAILKGLVRHAQKPIKGPGKAGRPRKFDPQMLQPARTQDAGSSQALAESYQVPAQPVARRPFPKGKKEIAN